jgi:hypothetical protein
MSAEGEGLNRFLMGEPREILRRLAEHAQKFGSWKDEPIEVTVFLASGHAVKGQVARLQRERDQENVLLFQGDLRDPAVIYIRLADVAALEIQHAVAVDPLGGAGGQKARTGEPPSRLDLKRELEKKSQILQGAGFSLALECDWSTIGESPEERFGLAEALAALEKVILKIGKESLGREALKKIATLRLQGEPNAKIRCERQETTVNVFYDWRRSLAGTFESDFERQLESAL